ncbi:MAG: aminotransferase class III-fold pyridoxal phosphate-dependent enzyme [Odoribacteraceae bacterium]|jgi:acetylornithine aminotransferase|nr:aminotransferase class III-fold pyridoxal phosphate-dependent enzyme [Odoribacteraceae bacterium]
MLFNVYNLMEIEPVEANGCWLCDRNGEAYLDLYGGHAVISIGHSHPRYVERLTRQLQKIGFYSNSVINPLQEELAARIEELSGCAGYNLFLCNSGAEANENALKLASFVTGRAAVLACRASFHGRTSAAVAVTDQPAIQAPLNKAHAVSFIDLDDIPALAAALATREYAAVIVEGIQGVGGIRVPSPAFLRAARAACDASGTLLLLDEVQSGHGRSGEFFAFQHAGIQPDIISMAKGMGNGFPVAGILIRGSIPAREGMLGSTFGGNHLACTAALAVLEVIERERLVERAAALGKWLARELRAEPGVIEVRGQGLMIGVDLDIPQAIFRRQLLRDYRILTGYSGHNTLRLLPPLTVSREELALFMESFRATTRLITKEDHELHGH